MAPLPQIRTLPTKAVSSLMVKDAFRRSAASPQTLQILAGMRLRPAFSETSGPYRMEWFIEGLMREMDDAANMDW